MYNILQIINVGLNNALKKTNEPTNVDYLKNFSNTGTGAYIYKCYALQYSTVQYSTVQYSTVQTMYSTVQYSTVQYSTVQNGTVQYGTSTFISILVAVQIRTSICS